MHKPRDYQEAAIAAPLDYWAKKSGSPLIKMATGTGKSLVIAGLNRVLVRQYEGFRTIVCTHVEELVSQNFSELIGIWPLAPAGIHSAALGQRATRHSIIFASIQSSYRKAEQFGSIDLFMVDEAHLLPPGAKGMYGRLIRELTAINGDMRVIGFTATPYRFGSGRLDRGEGAMFDDIIYEYGIADGVRDGYLTRLVSKATETGFDLTGVGKRGGEYIEGQLQSAVDKDEITRRAIDEAVAYGANRKTWLAFCSGVDHAFHVRDEIRSRGFSCETITGDTPKGERRQHLADLKSGKLRAVTNNSVMTTGTNIPGLDLILALRPTGSPGLYEQMMGRGTRVVYAPNMPLDTVEQRLAAIAAGPKPNCLVLDFAGLIRTHGPVDCVKPPGESKGGGIAPVKECPSCHSLLHASLRVCPDCNHIFVTEPTSKLTAKASAMAIMGSAPAEWVGVKARNFTLHHKPDKPVGIVARFQCGFVVHKAYYGPGRPGGVLRGKGDKFWLAHGGQMPLPRTADDWIARQGELAATEQISVEPDGKYINVVDARPAALPAARTVAAE